MVDPPPPSGRTPSTPTHVIRTRKVRSATSAASTRKSTEKSPLRARGRPRKSQIRAGGETRCRTKRTRTRVTASGTSSSRGTFYSVVVARFSPGPRLEALRVRRGYTLSHASFVADGAYVAAQGLELGAHSFITASIRRRISSLRGHLVVEFRPGDGALASGLRVAAALPLAGASGEPEDPNATLGLAEGLVGRSQASVIGNAGQALGMARTPRPALPAEGALAPRCRRVRSPGRNPVRCDRICHGAG